MMAINTRSGDIHSELGCFGDFRGSVRIVRKEGGYLFLLRIGRSSMDSKKVW